MASKVSKKNKGKTSGKPRPITPLEKMKAQDKDPEHALSTMNPALRKKYEEIKEWDEKENRSSIMSRYELGLIIAPVYRDQNDTSDGGEVYGRDAINRLEVALNQIWEDSLLYICGNFVRAYTKEEAERICQLRMKNGGSVSWSHVRCLIPLEPPSKREELLQLVVEKSWTSQELAYEILQRYPKEPNKERHGRPLAKPKDFDGVIMQEDMYADQFIERATEVWGSEDHSLEHHYSDLAPDDHTEERAQRLKAHAAKMRKVADEAEKLAQEAAKTYERFLEILKQQEKAKGKAPAVEEDEQDEEEDDTSLEVEESDEAESGLPAPVAVTEAEEEQTEVSDTEDESDEEEVDEEVDEEEEEDANVFDEAQEEGEKELALVAASGPGSPM